MTLDRHRSKLIPDVIYGGDGTLFVTEDGGTFPLRGKAKAHKDVRQAEFESEKLSYRSYDAARDNAKRRYKQRGPSRFGAEVQSMSGTVSTQSSSLGRRLRKSRRGVPKNEKRYPPSVHSDGSIAKRGAPNGGSLQARRPRDKGHNFGTRSVDGYGSQRGGGGSQGRRVRGGKPQMPPEFAETLRRSKSARSMSRGTVSHGSLRERNNNVFNGSVRGGMGMGMGMGTGTGTGTGTGKRRKKSKDDSQEFNPNILDEPASKLIDSMARGRLLSEEHLPYVVFLIDGILLILIGITRGVLSYWHEYFCALWSGIIILILGIIGARHKGRYLVRHISVLYIVIGFLTTFVVLASSSIVCIVLVRSLVELAGQNDPVAVSKSVAFSNIYRTLSGVDIDTSTMVWISIALDFSTLVLFAISFYSLTAAMIAISNYWDASFYTTGECDHRGNPRFFHPLQQAVLGQATTFVGIVYVVTATALPNVQHQLYGAPIWAGLIVMVAGILSFCYGKRVDKTALGGWATVAEVVAVIACATATIVTTLGLVNDIGALLETFRPSVVIRSEADKDTIKRERSANAVLAAIYDLFLVINVVFAVGLLFRLTRKLCCRRCLREDGNEDASTDL